MFYLEMRDSAWICSFLSITHSRLLGEQDMGEPDPSQILEKGIGVPAAAHMPVFPGAIGRVYTTKHCLDAATGCGDLETWGV